MQALKRQSSYNYSEFIILIYSILAIDSTDITVLEGKEYTLFCNVQNEQVIWNIDGIPTSGNENFQPSSNSTLIIRNSASDGRFGGKFVVSCIGNSSHVTDGRVYHVHLTKGILRYVKMHG